MAERDDLLGAMVAAFQAMPARHEPQMFYVNRKVLAGLRAYEDGWRYFLRLWWKWGRWPLLTRGIVEAYGGDREPHIKPVDEGWIMRH
jgi:hypothetical protein